MEGYSKLTCLISGEYNLLVYVIDKYIDDIAMFDYDIVFIPYLGKITNKVAIAITFTLYDSSFCFIACHLVSGTDNNCARKDQIKYIHSHAFKHSKRLHEEFDVKILFGDLNFRLNLNSFKTFNLIKEHNLLELFKAEQLSQNLKYGYLTGYKEYDITFLPTYAYVKNTDEYDQSKKRGPSWCDRILYSGNPCPYYYSDIKVNSSSHRPVEAQFKIKVKKIDLELKRITEEQLLLELAAGPLGSLPKMNCVKDLLSCN